MYNLENLKNITSRKEFATLLGYKPKGLTSILYATLSLQKYYKFEIPKKSGGARAIKAPFPKLKELQKRLAHLLYVCLENIDKKRNAKPLSFGYKENKSIVDNARCHKAKRWVLNLDIEDFFENINFGRVRGFFIKDKNFSLHPDIATVIAQIACDKNALPQGSPCSPIISELIGQILDSHLVQLAKKYKVTYSRYVDDITFSTNQKEFPTQLACCDSNDNTKYNLNNELIKAIHTAGFKINQNKTRMHFKNSRQMVTGLVVNKKANIPSDYYRTTRAMCASLFESGKYFSHVDEEGQALTDNLYPLEGRLSYIYHITQQNEKRPIQEQRDKPRAIRKLYRRFLFYKYFVNPQKPLIITEGKTDIIYIKNAIKALTNDFSNLGKVEDDHFQHQLKYLNYDNLTEEILQLYGGGSSNLISIPELYRKNLHSKNDKPRNIKHTPMNFPVIIIADNDDGLKPLRSYINDNYSIDLYNSPPDSFYHITDNLYILKVSNEKDICIEDLFPEEVRKIKLNNKTFNYKDKEKNEKKEYGKIVFATSIIAQKYKEINFDGFKPLLSNISKLLDNYSKNNLK